MFERSIDLGGDEGKFGIIQIRQESLPKGWAWDTPMLFHFGGTNESAITKRGDEVTFITLFRPVGRILPMRWFM